MSFLSAQYSEASRDVNLIELRSANKSQLQEGYVLVKVHASAINPVDDKVFGGYLSSIWKVPLPFVPGYDLSGVVDSVAEGVTDFSVGDEVFSVNWGKGKHDNGDDSIAGSFAEYVAIPASKLSKKPAEVSHEVAAAVSLVGTTAYQVLDAGKVTNGSKVLILGGSSAVGQIAIQLAKLRGAWVAATTSSRSLEFTKQFGADRLINYTETQWWSAEEEELRNFDFVFDTVGEAEGWAHAQTPGLVKEGGVFISIAAYEAGFDPTVKQAHFSAAFFFCLSNDTKIQDELAQLIVAGKLNVVIDEVFPFTTEGVRGIFTKIQGGKSLGKNVLKIVA